MDTSRLQIRWKMRLGGLIALVLGLSATTTAATPLSVALVPPQDYEPTLAQLTAIGKAMGITVTQLTPAELVNAAAFNAANYPLAVYTGRERYCYTVDKPGDGASALLRYVREGGVLLVAGLCWPFYRPVDYVNGEWVASQGELPEFAADADEHLRRQMERLNQSAVGNFNRYIGLNISGEGTTQFESPEEPVTLRRNTNTELTFGLPEQFEFPAQGDLRYRPVSARHGMPQARFVPIVTAFGDSGNEYGPGIAVVTREPQEGRRGTVIYVWGTFMSTRHAPGIVREVIRLAARESATSEDRARVADLTGKLQGMVDASTALQKTLTDAPDTTPALTYLRRQTDHVAEALRQLQDTIVVRSFGPAERSLTGLDDTLQRLEGRVAGLVAGR